MGKSCEIKKKEEDTRNLKLKTENFKLIEGHMLFLFPFSQSCMDNCWNSSYQIKSGTGFLRQSGTWVCNKLNQAPEPAGPS